MADNLSSVADDPRWRVFLEQGYDCSCGQHHVGPFPIEILHPIGWPGPKDYEPDGALRLEGNFLSPNFCVWEGKYYSMRMRLPLPVRGVPGWNFLFTAWASVDRVDFEAYVDALKNKRLDKTAKARARLVNRLTGYPETAMLMGTAFQQEDGGAPLLLIHGLQTNNVPDHPIMREQRDGIDLDRMLELFASYDHDMRPAAGR